MWGRVIEIMTAVWLALSPFIFRVEDSMGLVAFDSLAALTIAGLAGLSYLPALRHIHFAILVVAIVLVTVGRFWQMPPSPPQQNHIVVGLFLLMIAVIPNHASHPPDGWRKHLVES
jgi:hypothetical protein